RQAPLFVSLFRELQALLYAEAVLLVDDDQRQGGKLDALLEQRVGADHHAYLPAGDGRERAAPRTRRQSTRQQRDRLAERCEPVAERAPVLLGQQFRGRPQRRLQAAAGGARGRRRRHHGLAAADVALQQPHHRHAGGEVLVRIGERARLGARQGERQRREEPARESLAVRERPGGV